MYPRHVLSTARRLGGEDGTSQLTLSSQMVPGATQTLSRTTSVGTGSAFLAMLQGLELFLLHLFIALFIILNSFFHLGHLYIRF